jgi:hypothetical protein
MKLLSSLVVVLLLSGCVAGSTIPHDDSPAVVNQDAGPGLCSDATPPPCNPPRD